MPVNNDVGTSEYTEIKQQHFNKIIDIHIESTLAILRKNNKRFPGWCEKKYYYFDINAGPGMVNGEEGSPLIFLNYAKKHKDISFHVVLIENNKTNILELSEKMQPYLIYPNLVIDIRFGDHNKIIPEYFVAQKRNRFGLIYNDPSGKVPSFDLLQAMSGTACYSKLDILINCPSATIKRVSRSPLTKSKETLIDYLNKIDKEHWLIREFYFKHQWTFLIGTNWINFPRFKKIGMYPMSSVEGKKILYDLNYTTSEKKEMMNEANRDYNKTTV
jgi:three-Cys-motif partner protein